MRIASGCRLGFGLLFLLLSGCAAAVPHWRDDAYASFNAAVAASADFSEPDEADTARRTLELAERYYKSGMIEEANNLYRLAGLESRLISRSLLAASLRRGAGVGVDPDGSGRHNSNVDLADRIVSLNDAVQEAEHRPGQSGLAPKNADSATPPALLSDHDAPPEIRSRPVIRPNPSQCGTPSPARPSLSRTLPGRSTIYLTFDDGPSCLTLPIASYLKSQGIRATFFVLGCNVKGHEKAITSLIAMGHRVGSHTFSHNLHKLRASFDGEANEIVRTASLIERLGGDGRMVRIPYGASNRKLVSRVTAEGAQIFEWDIDSYDSTKRGTHDRRFIDKAVLGQLAESPRRHAIVLFHDGSGHDATLAALKDLIPLLKEQGYRFGVLSHNDKMARLSTTGDPKP